MIAAAVHTTGVNWQSVAVITSIVVGLLSTVFGVVARLVSNQITAAINKFRVDVVSQLDTRLTSVETKLDDLHGKRR